MVTFNPIKVRGRGCYLPLGFLQKSDIFMWSFLKVMQVASWNVPRNKGGKGLYKA